MPSVTEPFPLSREDLHRLENEGGVEYADGRILLKPVTFGTCVIESTIGYLLGQYSSRCGAVYVLSASLGYRCFRDDPHKVHKPSVSVVKASRATGIDPRVSFMPIPADLVVEVISPNDRAYDVASKIDEYLSNGFPLIWIVHPNIHTGAVHRADGSLSTLHEGDELTGESALPGFRCKVAELFATPA